MSFLRVMLGLVLMSAMALVLAGYFGVSSPATQSERLASVPTGNDAAPPESDAPGLAQLFRALQITAGGGGLAPISGAVPRFDSPDQTLQKVYYGAEIRHPGMIGRDGGLAFVSDAIDGYPVTPRRPEIPAAVTPLEPLADCTPRRPAPGEVLANIQVFDGGRTTGLNATNSVELGQQVMTWVERVQSRASDLNSLPRIKGNPVEAITVVLTDTSAPQYLILQANETVLWNVQAAPGVEISHVVLVGKKGQALHAPAGDFPVEAVLIGPDCAPRPARAVSQDWGMFDSPAPSEQNAQKEQAAYEAYTAWFASRFGMSSETDVIGARTASHVLVGEMPSNRLPYRAIDGAIIRAVPEERMLFGAEEQLSDTLRVQALEIARAAAGGDLSILQPAPKGR